MVGGRLPGPHFSVTKQRSICINRGGDESGRRSMKSESTRRTFLKQSTHAAALAAATAALGPVHAAGEEQPASVRLGIIGCGGIMGHHVKGLVTRGEDVSFAWL